MGGGVFGLLPTSILGEIGDSLPRASDRYTYTVSVPNMYHSLGRVRVQTLREAVGQERAEEWEQAMQARQDAEAARVAQQETRLKAKYKEAKAAWYSYGGTPRRGYRAIAKHLRILVVLMWHLSRGEYKEGLDDLIWSAGMYGGV